MPLGSQWCCSAGSACMGRHRACVSWTTPSCFCGSCLLIRAGSAMLYGVALKWRSSVPPECDGVICEGILFVFLSVLFDQFDGPGCQAWDIVRCSFGRLFVGRSRTGHSIRLWRGCYPRMHRADMRTAPSLAD